MKRLKILMKTERFSLTCAPGGENNRGMEIIGRMPIKGEGFTAKDIEGLAPYFQKLLTGEHDGDSYPKPDIRMIDLNVDCGDDKINNFR